MAVIFDRAEQIITLSPGDVHAQPRMAVQRVVLNATAAGNFVVLLGDATLTLSNSANVFLIDLPVYRGRNSASLVSGPAGAVAYVMLESKM